MDALERPSSSSRLWVEDAAPGIEHVFRLPLPGWPRAFFKSGFGYENARLIVDGARLVQARSREELEQGVEGRLKTGEEIAMSLTDRGLIVAVANKRALREDRIFARPTCSAWVHAVLAFLGSGAGFIASWFYLAKSSYLEHLSPMSSAWAHKMGIHMAGWHLLLTLTLFPASVWGQRTGIRAVQITSFVFFCIHVGIALANADLADPSIAFFNAVSGILFGVSVLYGQRAHADMDPIRALKENRL